MVSVFDPNDLDAPFLLLISAASASDAAHLQLRLKHCVKVAVTRSLEHSGPLGRVLAFTDACLLFRACF